MGVATASASTVPRYRSVKQAQAFLAESGIRMSLTQVYAAIERGDLPHVRINGRIHVPDLETWLEERARIQTADASRRRTPSREPAAEQVALAPREEGVMRLIKKRRLGTPQRGRP